MKLKVRNKKVYYNLKSGISLIVLVVTIIVMLILVAAISFTMSYNNPIADANDAKYESDVLSIQDVFSDIVSEVVSSNGSTITIKAGQINTITGGVDTTTGTVEYTVNNKASAENENGTIEFGEGNNTKTKFYTSIKLPIYKAGTTIWYVSEKGTISLSVDGVLYGQ